MTPAPPSSLEENPAHPSEDVYKDGWLHVIL